MYRLRVYRHVRVVSGVTCSPLLLNAVIKKIIWKFKNSFYIDNCEFGVDTQEELQEFIKKDTEIFADLRSFSGQWCL